MALIPTAYLPPVSYFVILTKYKEVRIERYETYPKQTYRNRCRILTANGPLNLIIPVTKKNSLSGKTGDISICYEEGWQINHWRAIESAYNSSPFFLYYADDLYLYYSNMEISKLFDFNYQLISGLLSLMGMNCSLKVSENYLKAGETDNDYRQYFNPKKKVNKELFSTYNQVFGNKFGFIPDLSIIDLLFNKGPESVNYLENL